jgi:hypothetical protein
LIEPTGVDQGMDQQDTGIDVTQPLLRSFTAMQRAVVHEPEKSFAGTVRLLLVSLLGFGVGILAGLRSAAGHRHRSPSSCCRLALRVSWPRRVRKRRSAPWSFVARTGSQAPGRACRCCYRRRVDLIYLDVSASISTSVTKLLRCSTGSAMGPRGNVLAGIKLSRVWLKMCDTSGITNFTVGEESYGASQAL